MYTMKTATKTGNGAIERENTFTDTMFAYIADKLDNNNNVLSDLSEYILYEEYETDCIMSDIDIYLNDSVCNIFYGINNNIKCIQYIKQFIKYYNISSNQFSTGISFFYHKYYKNTRNQKKIKHQQTWSANQNDFGGHSFSGLFVCAHFNSLKEEVLNSPFINISEFNEKVIDKGNKYIITTKCKQIKCIEPDDELHFGIKSGAALSESHLHSLTLYCDFTDFCTSFSSTFRKIKWNEPINKVKQRNSKYAHISMYLKEIIQYFGIKGNYEIGPFYT